MGVSLHFSAPDSVQDSYLAARHKVPSPLRGSGSVSKWPVSGSGVPESVSGGQTPHPDTGERNITGEGNILDTFTRASSEQTEQLGITKEIQVNLSV